MSTLTPIVVVRVDDREIAQEDLRAIRSVKLVLAERKADTGQIVFSDPDSRIYDSRTYRKGARLVLTMGWTNALEIRGPYVVKGYKPLYPEDGDPTLTVDFQDESHSMNRRQRRRRFADLTPAQIIEQIADEHELGFDIESPENVRFTDDFPLIQANATDARLMQQLAERYGYVWGVEGGTLYFRRPVDLEALQQQSEVPVLSYRINDWSLKSFAPEIKFQSGRRRRGARQTAGNVDLTRGTSEDNGIFEVLRAGREEIEGALPRLAEVVRGARGQDTDDDEPNTTPGRSTDAQDDVEDQREERARGRQRVDRVRTEVGEEEFPDRAERDDEPEENEESEPGDESGAATPQTEGEARRRAAGRSARASEIVEGIAVPSIASMRWRPQAAVVLAGIGERNSGRYRVAEVTHTVTKEGVFTTSLRVKKQVFRPSAADTAQIAQASDRGTTAVDAASGRSSADGPPPPTTEAEERYRIDTVRTRATRRRRVDGQDVD